MTKLVAEIVTAKLVVEIEPTAKLVVEIVVEICWWRQGQR